MLHEREAGIRNSSHPSKEVQKSPRVGRGKKSGLGRHPRPLAWRNETPATRRQVRSRGELHPGQGIKRALAQASRGADARAGCRANRQGARSADCQPHQRIVGRAWRDDPGEGFVVAEKVARHAELMDEEVLINKIDKVKTAFDMAAAPRGSTEWRPARTP